MARRTRVTSWYRRKVGRVPSLIPSARCDDLDLDRCAQLVGSYRSIPRAVRAAVSRECERFVRRHIEGRKSFAVETTLRTLAAVRQAEAARKDGFLTRMNFVATGSPALNIERILQRAQAGGHAASESEVRLTYAASLENLLHAIQVFARQRGCFRPFGWTSHD